MKRKFLLGIFAAIALMAFVSAAIYVEPWNVDVDAGNNSITNVYNLSAELVYGTFTGDVTGDVIGDVTGDVTGDLAGNVVGNFSGNASGIFEGNASGLFYGNLSGNMAWSNLTDYPAACPGGSAITTLGDSVTCSDLWVDVAGDVMTGGLNMSQNNISNISYLNPGAQTLFIGGNLTVNDNLDVVGNMSLGDKITFGFGQFIDNLVDGWLRITGNLQVDGDTNMTGNLNVSGALDVSGKITNDINHIYILNSENYTIASGGVWYNVSFNTSLMDNDGFTLNSDNITFVIPSTAHYEIDFGAGFVDSNAAADAHVAIRVIVNNAELFGSYIEGDSTKQDADLWLEHTTHAELTSGDNVSFQ